jgi:hypothetical protein
MERKEMDCGRKMIFERYFRVFLRVFPRQSVGKRLSRLRGHNVEKSIIRQNSNFLINKFRNVNTELV